MKKIRIFDLKFDKSYENKFISGSKQILKEGFLANHTYVRKLEKKLQELFNVKHCLLSTSGTSALELIFRSLKIKNKKVLVGNNTFIATATAIMNAGGIPIPVDIENEYYSLCPIELEKKIKKYKKKIGAVVMIHIGGLISPKIYRIRNICKKNKISLIEDAAQSFGSTLNKKFSGTFGLAGAFSFQTTKPFTTGEGGCLITNSTKLYNDAKSLRQFGFEYKNNIQHNNLGNNFKVSEFVALAGLCELDRIKKRIKKRQTLAAQYQKRLFNSPWKTLKPAKNSLSTYYKQIVISPINRNFLIKKFKEKNIAMTGGVYYLPLSKQKIIKKFLDKKDKFKVSNFFCDKHFCPPCYPELSVKDVNYICDFLLKIKNY